MHTNHLGILKNIVSDSVGLEWVWISNQCSDDFMILISHCVQSLSPVWLFAHSVLYISQRLPKLMSIALVMLSNNHILYFPLLLLPSIFPSIRGFSNESALCIRWPKYRSFTNSISPSNEYSGLISLNIDWFDLLAVQGTLKSLLQYYNLFFFSKSLSLLLITMY